MIEVKNADLDKLAIESVRYCLGRKTYAVSECDEIIRRYWRYFSKGAKQVIRRDIAERIKTHDLWIELDFDEPKDKQKYLKSLNEGDSYLGNECDAWTWIELLDWIDEQEKQND